MKAILPFTGPYDVEAILATAAAHAVPGLEHVDVAAGVIERAVPGPDGPAALRIELSDEDAVVTLLEPEPRPEPVSRLDSVPGPGPAARLGPAGAPPPGLRERVRFWLALDADPREATAALAADPLLASLIAARPGVRVLASPDPFATCCLAVIGQQISLAATRTLGARLVAGFGEPAGAGLIAFPSPAALARAGPDGIGDVLRSTRRRAATLHALAIAIEAGEVVLPLRRRLTPVEEQALLAVPGIGPWTVAYVALRTTAAPDLDLSGDLVLRRALGGIGIAQARERARAWSPHRTLATVHLWTAESYLGPA